MGVYKADPAAALQISKDQADLRIKMQEVHSDIGRNSFRNIMGSVLLALVIWSLLKSPNWEYKESIINKIKLFNVSFY